MLKLFKTLNYSFILFLAIAVICSSYFSTVIAQETNTEDTFVVIHTLGDGSIEIIQINSDNTSNLLLSISSSECFTVNNYIDIIAISQSSNPESIIIYDISTGQQLRQIMWQSEWITPCRFRWNDNSANLFITISIDDNSWLGTEINVLTGASQPADLLLDPIADMLPDLTPIGPLYIQSPNSDLVVYMRCNTSETRPSTYGGEECNGGSRPVIYDLSGGTNVAVLENAIAGRSGPAGPIDFFSAFAWSSSGRFLAYVAPIEDQIIIYDALSNTFNTVLLDVTGYHIWQIFAENSLQWSPDETRIAFWLRNFEDSPRVAFHDRSNAVLTSFAFTNSINQDTRNSWGWLSDSQGIGVLLTNNELVEIGVGGIQQQIASDVTQIYTFYSDPNLQEISTLTLINADMDTDIRTLSTTSTETIDIASTDISIRADTDPATVGSVVFSVDGNVVATDNSAPYTIAGENGTDILPWNIALGQHTVVATPYSGADGTGDAGTPLTVQVNIVDSSQSGLAVTSMTLINADTDTDIRSLLTSGTDTIDISSNGISIRANTSPGTVGSVIFALNSNANYRTENGAPYAIYNNEPGAYQPWVVAPGNYTLTATPYSGSNGSGTSGTPLTVNFDIVNTPPSGSCTATGGLVQEGEAGVRAGNFVVANDTIASGGQYVHVPDGTGSNYSPGSSSNVRFCFPVTDAGTYRLKAWVHSADGGADSFYVGYNGATIQWNTEINTIYSIGYVRGTGTPVNSAQEYTLTSGNHEFTFFLREDGARLDKVELMNTVSNETVLYRVDAGASSAYTDTLGNVWAADSNFSGGSANSFSGSILSTIEDTLYTTERSQSNNVGFSYSFPVSNGTYTVRLHFAEIWFVGGSGRGAIDSPSAQRRVFDVQIEGVTVLDEFHIVSETLQPRVAHVETFSVNVTDGTLNINFPPATTDNPTVEAIEIVQGG